MGVDKQTLKNPEYFHFLKQGRVKDEQPIYAG